MVPDADPDEDGDAAGGGRSPELVPDGGCWLLAEEPPTAALLLTLPWPNLLPIGGLESYGVERKIR